MNFCVENQQIAQLVTSFGNANQIQVGFTPVNYRSTKNYFSMSIFKSLVFSMWICQIDFWTAIIYEKYILTNSIMSYINDNSNLNEFTN